MRHDKPQYLKLCKDLIEAEREDWLIIDTETTGLDDGEICQVAIIDGTGFVWFNNYIKTNQPIPEHATLIHGISDDMVKDAPTWKDIWTIYAGFLKGHKVITYNAVYDRKMMHKSSERWGLPHYDWKEHSEFYCAMEAFAEYYGDWNDWHKSYRWQKLSKAANFCNVEIKEAHSALGDCRMTLAVVNYMLQMWSDKQADKLDENSIRNDE